jgi:hypothetical protein
LARLACSARNPTPIKLIAGTFIYIFPHLEPSLRYRALHEVLVNLKKIVFPRLGNLR